MGLLKRSRINWFIIRELCQNLNQHQHKSKFEVYQ